MKPKIIHVMSGALTQSFGEINQIIRICVEDLSGKSTFDGDTFKVVRYDDYLALKNEFEKLVAAQNGGQTADK